MALFIHKSTEAGIFGCLGWLVQIFCYGVDVAVGVSVLKVQRLTAE